MSQEKTHEFFGELCGNKLSSVEFVMDYLQLRFDGPCINVNNPLTVRTPKKQITSRDNGFRDLLCQQISKQVITIDLEEDKALNIYFDNNSRISISLRPEDYTSPEAIYAHGFKDNGWLVL
jgi:hypothetical protein